jgi:hypothetical protein
MLVVGTCNGKKQTTTPILSSHKSISTNRVKYNHIKNMCGERNRKNYYTLRATTISSSSSGLKTGRGKGCAKLITSKIDINP